MAWVLDPRRPTMKITDQKQEANNMYIDLIWHTYLWSNNYNGFTDVIMQEIIDYMHFLLLRQTFYQLIKISVNIDQRFS